MGDDNEDNNHEHVDVEGKDEEREDNNEHDQDVERKDEEREDNNINSPQKSETSSPATSTKSNKEMYDEDDNSSSCSSSSTSTRTNKLKVTVPMAPKFTCEQRLEKRKEYYAKLEEKHKALEKERLQQKARIKEEEAAAIKELRKSMVYKANPVPSFYREGPPPKVELKKIPVTRPKSPKLTRRRSCSDALRTSHEETEHNEGECRRSLERKINTAKGTKSRVPGTRNSNENKSSRVNVDHAEEQADHHEDTQVHS